MWELCYRFISSAFSFCKIKGYCYWKYKFYRLWDRNPASGLFQISHKSKKLQWRHNLLTWSHVHFFLFFLFLFSGLVTGPIFISILLGSGVITVLFYNRLIRNPDIRNTLICVLTHIWRLGWVRNTKFGTNVFNEKLLNATKCQDYSFYHFWVIKGKSTGVVKLRPTPRSGLKNVSVRIFTLM